MITLRTVGAKWLVDATRDGPTTTEGAAVSAEVVQTVADHLHDAKLSGAPSSARRLAPVPRPTGPSPGGDDAVPHRFWLSPT